MKNKSMISIVAVSLLLLAGIAVVALAGVDPSPFTPEINQLGAVENGLNSCLDRITKILDRPPPDDTMPSPNVNGAVNRLEAVDGQINSLRNFVISIVDAVLGIDPVPFREGVITALQQVKTVSMSIAETVDDYLKPPPDDGHPAFVEAVEMVEDSIMLMNTTIDESIIALQDGGCTPVYDIPEAACPEFPGCSWIVADGDAFCCCTIIP